MGNGKSNHGRKVGAGGGVLLLTCIMALAGLPAGTVGVGERPSLSIEGSGGRSRRGWQAGTPRVRGTIVPDAVAAALDPGIEEMVGQIDADRIAADIQRLADFGTRNTCSDASGGSRGIGAARDWLQGQFAAIPGLGITLAPFDYAGCGGTVTRHNVIAWLPGEVHPERLIVIGGHYDSRTVVATDGVSSAPGANDSGSQAALVLEAARVMAGHTFDATLVFAAWAGEEQGLYGSSSFVRDYQTYFPASKLELDLNCDIVGGDNTVNDAGALQSFRLYSPGTPREISAGDGTTDNTSPSRGLMRYVGYWGGAYVPGMSMTAELREDRFAHSSDHASFIGEGIPAVRFIESNETAAHQHTAADQFRYVTPAFTARVAQVVVGTAASLARGPQPPTGFSARLRGSDAVKLKWKPPASGPEVDHYVVSARALTENFYRGQVAVPAGTGKTVVRIAEELGIDAGSGFFISVAAVDARGHQSLFSYPEYRCDSNGCAAPAGALDVTATR
jgi:hypothetical protein